MTETAAITATFPRLCGAGISACTSRMAGVVMPEFATTSPPALLSAGGALPPVSVPQRTLTASAVTAAIARGDRAAFGEFYEAWFDRCYAMARRLSRRDESACLDIVQEAMLRVVKKMRALPDEAALEAWMARVVRSATVDLLRRDLRRAQREEGRVRAADRGHAESLSHPGEAAAVRDEAERLRAALAEIPSEDAAALSLRLARGRTLDSTGAGLGTTGDAAHGRVRRAVAALRTSLKGHDHD